MKVYRIKCPRLFRVLFEGFDEHHFPPWKWLSKGHADVKVQIFRTEEEKNLRNPTYEFDFQIQMKGFFSN